MKCPVCDQPAGDDVVEVTRHVEQEHPEWNRQFKSKSYLRRIILMTNDDE